MNNQNIPVKVSSLPTCQLQHSSLKHHLVHFPKKSIHAEDKNLHNCQEQLPLGLFFHVIKLLLDLCFFLFKRYTTFLFQNPLS